MFKDLSPRMWVERGYVQQQCYLWWEYTNQNQMRCVNIGGYIARLPPPPSRVLNTKANRNKGGNLLCVPIHHRVKKSTPAGVNTAGVYDSSEREREQQG